MSCNGCRFLAGGLGRLNLPELVAAGKRTVMVGRGEMLLGLLMVSPMEASLRPLKAQMSPASTRWTGTRLKLSYTNSSATLPGRGFSSPVAWEADN